MSANPSVHHNIFSGTSRWSTSPAGSISTRPMKMNVPDDMDTRMARSSKALEPDEASDDNIPINTPSGVMSAANTSELIFSVSDSGE